MENNMKTLEIEYSNNTRNVGGWEWWDVRLRGRMLCRCYAENDAKYIRRLIAKDLLSMLKEERNK